MTGKGKGGRWGQVAVARLVVVAFASVLLGQSGIAAVGLDESRIKHVGQKQDIELKPAQIVILVDESGSISEDDLRREQDASSLIAQGEVSPKSTVSVVGFASDSGTKSPVDVVCPPLLVAGAAERDRLSQCVRDLRKRTTGEGAGTDHAEALRQALSYLGSGSPDDGPKLVFLLTDGVLDVSDSGRYGVDKSAEQRNDAAREVIRRSLVTAREQGIQVWPLGFGAVDKGALDEFAAGGYQGSCGPNVPKPSATVVSSSADVARALLNAYSSGRCVGLGPINDNELDSGADFTSSVTVPAIATDGSIFVVKHDGRVRVDYLDPQGRTVPKSGRTESGAFQVSGESGAVEVLRITDPMPGEWKVKVTSLPEVPPQRVLTTVTWIGAAQASILIDPPSPAKDQDVTVSLQVILRGGKPVAQPDLLTGLTFTAEMGNAATPARNIELRDDGQAPDGASDGTYTGRLRIPDDVRDEVTFRGRVSGLGISATDAVATVRVASGVPGVLATATVPTVNDTVAPGDSFPVAVSVANSSGARQKLRVVVRGDNGAQITIPAGDTVHEVDQGSSSFTFPLEFGSNTPEGITGGVVQVVDDNNPSSVLHEKPFKVTVALPPSWGLYILITVLFVALAVAAFLLRARRRSQEVEGLQVQAIRNGMRTYLATEARKARQFRFTLDMTAHAPALDNAAPGDPSAFVLTRTRASLQLKTPYGAVRYMQLGEEVDLGDDLAIVVTVDPEQVESGRTDEYEPVEGDYEAHAATGWDDFGPPSPPQQTMRDPLL